MKKQKFDQLETFFIQETMHLIGTYEALRERDPRDETPLFNSEGSLDDELHSIKGAWTVLIAYANKYGYKRFDNVNPNIEEFYLSKILMEDPK